MQKKQIITSAITGLLWGILGAAITNTYYPLSWYAIPFSGLIGVSSFFIGKWSYKKNAYYLVIVSILTTFTSVALFGITLGFIDLITGPSRIAWAVVIQGMNGCLFGLVAIPVFWVLFPLAFGNHLIIKAIDKKA